MSLCWKIPFFRSSAGKPSAPSSALGFELQSLMTRRKAKGAARWCWAQSSPQTPSLWGTVLVGQRAPASSLHWKTPCETQKILSGWNRERMIYIYEFYLVWNVVGWSPWKCECFSFSHYFIKNVTSWAGRRRESKRSTSGEMHRKVHLQSELRPGL